MTEAKNSEGRIKEPDLIALEMKKKLMDMEGECKIKEVLYLQINYPKAIVLILFMTMSVVGLLLLK